ncbi:C-GCAxxG-C-C family protein [Pectinatus haikarae]|uniref:C_GCAxxG_C_C family protein n=1 Tax=Pectinatus haikarae TaxID=349096 RepID=A0ABT9YAR5_9FIRM|nr:C-GCAxxG-C-C family protein [Pectinatus haikarae]MDQ0204940.1 hypothetical protein [Pectinatus haikarae]
MKNIVNIRVHDCYWKYDYCCAATSLKILSEIFEMEVSQQIFSAVSGLSAGRNRLQCGLVQGMLMFLGIYFKEKDLEQDKIADICHEYVNAFQNEFSSIECKELRPRGFSPNDPPHLCEQITKDAIYFAVKFVYKVADEHNLK